MTEHSAIDEGRAEHGFRTVAETVALAERGVRLFDPYSTLISVSARVATGVVIYPTVVLEADPDSSIVVGTGTVLHPGTFVSAGGGGRVAIGVNCRIGPGGVSVRSTGTSIEIGDEVRLLNGCEIVGNSQLGRGAQLIGAISAHSIHLEPGLGGWDWPVPDERGPVLKGAGLARGVHLSIGQVLSLQPSFDDTDVRRQSFYHPVPAR